METIELRYKLWRRILILLGYSTTLNFYGYKVNGTYQNDNGDMFIDLRKEKEKIAKDEKTNI